LTNSFSSVGTFNSEDNDFFIQHSTLTVFGAAAFGVRRLAGRFFDSNRLHGFFLLNVALIFYVSLDPSLLFMGEAVPCIGSLRHHCAYVSLDTYSVASAT
jgi:hypothetical protein